MYGVKFGRGVRVVAILMIFPAFFSIRVGMTALEQRKAVVRFSRMVSSHSLREISWIGAIGPLTPGVVHQDIDGAVGLQGFLNQGIDLVFIGNIGRNGDGVFAQTLQLLGYVLDLILVAGRHHDFGPFFPEKKSDGAPQPPPASGDNGDFILQFHNHSIPFALKFESPGVNPYIDITGFSGLLQSQYCISIEPLAKVGHSVIPAKAGIQNRLKIAGFRVALRLPGMTFATVFQDFLKSLNSNSEGQGMERGRISLLTRVL